MAIFLNIFERFTAIGVNHFALFVVSRIEKQLCPWVSTRSISLPVHHLNILIVWLLRHGPLTRYAKLQVAHAPGMPGTFPPAADFEGNRYLAIPACITARAWRTCRDACRGRLPAVTGKTFPAFPAHAHPQFGVSGKRPMLLSFIGILFPRTLLVSWAFHVKPHSVNCHAD